jgi:cell wall-associated NlpC family hydrolase
MLDEKIIIEKYLGVPYQHKGRTLAGLDCWGLVKMIYADLGFNLLDIENYDENWIFGNKNYFIENYHKEWRKVEKPELFDGILFINIKGDIIHAGIYLSAGRFIHTNHKQGTVISQFSNYKTNIVEGFYHLRARDGNS